MSKLLMLKGLPGSGKTTTAMELVKAGYKRVSKDDLRAMIDGGKWSKQNEILIRDIQARIVGEYIKCGTNVVVDDTNFAWEDWWKKEAEGLGAEFVIQFFDTPVMECVARDSLRGDKSVGAEVIMRMYNQYLKPKSPVWVPDAPQCFIFDIDGTLATMNGRSPYDYTRVEEDSVVEHIANIFDALRLSKEGYKMFIMSGRQTNCREETIDWLKENDIIYDELFMRAVDDKRKDSIIKQELYEAHIKGKYNVVAVFDDRNQVVDLWRSLGLTCCQVNYGCF